MISVWLGDRSSWTGVHLAELDRAFVDRSSGFVDQRGMGSWIGALGSWVGALGLWIGVLGWWIEALVCGLKLVLSVLAFVLCFSSLFLSVLLCVESDPKMN